MYDSAKKSILNDLLLVEMPVYYLYTANSIAGASTVSTFRLNPDGSPVMECEFPVRNPGASPGPILTHPVYNVLYSAENSQFVSYQLDISGRFTGTVKSIYALGGIPNSLCFSRNGGILYAGTQALGVPVYGFSLWADGTMYGSFQQPTTAAVWSFALHPNGKYMYAGFGGYVRRYIVDQATGSLSYGSDAIVPAIQNSMQAHQSGKYLYYSDNSDIIYLNDINFDGNLITPERSYSFTPYVVMRFVLHPCGNYLIAIGSNAGMSYLLICTISADGSLGIPAAYYFENRAAYDIKVHPDGRTIYISVGDGAFNYLYYFHFEPLTGMADVSMSSVTRIPASGTLAAFPNFMTIGSQGVPLLIDTKRFRK